MEDPGNSLAEGGRHSIRKINIFLNYLNGLISPKNNFKMNKGNKEDIFP